ncbi:DUF3089 domain-containing protein [Asticcacaulis sp. BYS171W]|uniref:DUF3089 domain-containing protein n=1 Tax=Asticcacaulis aquaticus TaxID=2984212 RepID=A0ABT5HP01_9CAUL|nr:DUF3089 domain-containing protein [Asticcacaulis aquaticus]MDC7681784.1 DUF3089 domain-containing protein [Asticcacaulis aquaticus]
MFSSLLPEFKRKWLKKNRLVAIGAGACLLILGSVGVWLWGDDILRHNLDPKVPFQIYQRPPAPDYRTKTSWFLNPALEGYEVRRNRNHQKLDVFFVHATSFNGGKHWLGPIDDAAASAEVVRNQLPNYAAPFGTIGYVYAPKYRQASLYSQLTQREDAREARQFAYEDVLQAFDAFLKQRRNEGGFIIVGIEQGGFLAQRLVQERIAGDEALASRLVAAYFIETLVPMTDYAPGKTFPACTVRAQAGCVVAYLSIDSGRPDRALQAQRRAMIWGAGDILEPMGDVKALCVNPLTGGVTDKLVDARHSLGAANATGLEWGAIPGLISRRTSARCRGEILYVSKPSGDSFAYSGSWAERRKVRAYNLFYGDLQADAAERWFSYQFQKSR